MVEEPFGRARGEMRGVIDLVACIDVPLEIALARRTLRMAEEVKDDARLREIVRRTARMFLSGGLRETYATVNQLAMADCDLVVDGTRPAEELAQTVAGAARVRRAPVAAGATPGATPGDGAARAPAAAITTTVTVAPGSGPPVFYVNARAIVERETANGVEVLLQVRDRPGWGGLELPGGRIEPFESFVEALAREVREETGLHVTAILDDHDRLLWSTQRQNGDPVEVECLRPAFVYQTVRGPFDTLGCFFRCRAEGTLLARGDAAHSPRWVPRAALRRQLAEARDTFDWLTESALAFYLRAHPDPPDPAAGALE